MDKDFMMRKCDEDLEELERRLREQYAQAQRELTERLNRFLRRYRTQQDVMLARLAAGEITQEAYDNWVRNQILTQRVYTEQIGALAHDLTHTDQIANAMINNELPDIYCSSYNFGLFRAETQANLIGMEYEGANFALYNAEAVRILIAEDPDLIPWLPPELNEALDFQWNRTQLQNAVTQGLLQGEHYEDIARRILPIVNNDAVAALRTARTAYTSVENQARRDASARVQAAGIPMDEPWLAIRDARTRDTHVMLDGTLPNAEGLYGEGIIPRGALLRFPADPRGAPEQIYNCRCRVQSYIHGIDWSDEGIASRYESFMTENHYDDWVGLRDGGSRTINGVRDYKVEEQRAFLERQRALRNGELVNREALIGLSTEERNRLRSQAAQRRQARQQRGG